MPATKPRKPYRNYPLTAHPNGQWCKRIRGRLVYFGPWGDPQAAIERYRQEFPILIAGGTVERCETLQTVVAAFLNRSQGRVATGDLTERSFDDLKENCELILDTLGRATGTNQISTFDMERLRSSLCKGKRGRVVAVSSQTRKIGMARQVFLFANEEFGANMPYRKTLKLPSARTVRASRNKARMFTADEVNALLEIAKPQMKAMIYLGINCGFGNRDCATIQIESVDIGKGWHNYARPKTGVERRCPLWDETTAALYKAIQDRTDGHVFLTHYGNPWIGKNRACPIAFEFRKLCQAVGIYVAGVTTFYSLRRTFETIGATTGDQIAVDYIMGHAPASNDMAAVYRQRTFDSQLRKVTDHVREWLTGAITL